MIDNQTLRPRQIVGINVRRLRQERGLSQRELVARMRALRFPWHPATAHEVEKQEGARQVTLDELVALAICLDTDIASLLDPVGAGLPRLPMEQGTLAEAGTVDVGLPWDLWGRFFRNLIPVSDKQGKSPRFVRTIPEWKDGKPLGGLQQESAIPADEDALHTKVKELETLVEQLKAALPAEGRKP